jgi:uncharacterized protein YegP (UPF0339 family)
MGLFNWLFGKNKKSNKDEAVTTAKTENIEKSEDNAISYTKPTKESKAPNQEENAKPEKMQAEPQMTAKSDTSVQIAATEKSISDSKGYTGKFEINKAKDGKYFFNLFASNKVGIATSQMYSTAQSALTGVKSVIVNAPKAPIEDQTLKNWEALPYPKWEIYLDNGNKYRFRLNAPNGSCICHSQGYTTKNACKNGIDSIIRSSKNAEIEKTYLAKKYAE